METDADLSTLAKRQDHLNVLRFIRVHQLREPHMVLEHGKKLLGETLSVKIEDLTRLAALEQICLAALDADEPETADLCLERLKEAGISQESTRFRCLLGRCLEAAQDFKGADLLYDELLQENPANLMALKRKYCIQRAQENHVESINAMNRYLEQNCADTAAWYEFAQYLVELGEIKRAAFCLEEVLLGAPTDSNIHCELAECYAALGGHDNLLLARKHMAQALELDGTNRQAQIGLVKTASAYLKDAKRDEHEVEVAKELVKYGVEQVLLSYKGSPDYRSIQAQMEEYIKDLS